MRHFVGPAVFNHRHRSITTENIDAETKWPTFRQRYFQMHFMNENVFTWYLTEMCSLGSDLQYH